MHGAAGPDSDGLGILQAAADLRALGSDLREEHGPHVSALPHEGTAWMTSAM